MAQEQVKFYKGTQEQIEQAPIKEGALYVTTDTKKMFADLGGERLKVGGDTNIDQLEKELTDLTTQVSDLDSITIQRQGTRISDLSWENLYKISQEAPGTYLVWNEATDGPETGRYGNILIAYSGGNRFVAILAYDNGHVYAQYASDTNRWIRIDTTADAFSGTLPLGKGGTGNTNRKDAAYSLSFLGFNPVSHYQFQNDTPSRWVELGPGYGYINYNEGQILQGLADKLCGPIINYVYGSIVMQQFLCSNGRIYYRYGTTTEDKWILGWRREDVGDILPVSRGGTGTAKGVFGTTGTNPIASNAEDTVAKWMTIPSGVYWITVAGLLSGQIAQYGYLLHINNGSNIGNQFFCPVSINSIQYRSFNGATGSNNVDGKMPNFRTILNSNGVVPIESGGTGASTAANARTNLGITTNTALTASNSDPIGYMTVGTAKIVSCVIPPFDLAAQSIATKTVTFPSAFKTMPQVVACLQSDSASYTIGWCSVATVTRTTTTATLKFFNGDTSSDRSMSARVLAFGAI